MHMHYQAHKNKVHEEVACKLHNVMCETKRHAIKIDQAKEKLIECLWAADEVQGACERAAMHIWYIYMYVNNLSVHTRKQSSHACTHRQTTDTLSCMHKQMPEEQTVLEHINVHDQMQHTGMYESTQSILPFVLQTYKNLELCLSQFL